MPERSLGAEGIPLGELAEAIGGVVEGDPEVRILGLAGLDDAAPGMLVRVEHPRLLPTALAGPAAAILTNDEVGPVARPCIRVPRVRLAFSRCLALFDAERAPEPGVHPTAVVGARCELAESCSIGAYAVLGSRVRVAEGAVIHPHVVVGDDAEIGPESVLFPHAVLYARTVVGARVRIHSGVVLGADGYGYDWAGDHHEKKPHIGRVRIGDDVEIGANTTIDRATTGETVIGPGTKIDNLAQIGHNVKTGAHCLIVAQAGIAGSSVLGNGVVIAGQVGVSHQVKIGDGAQVAGKSGVWTDVPAGGRVFGMMARPHREEMKIQAALSRLPDLLRRVKELEKRLEEKE